MAKIGGYPPTINRLWVRPRASILPNTSLHPRRYTHNEIIIRGETLRTIHKLGELCLLERWNAVLAVFQRLREFLPVRIEQLEGEFVRHFLHHPGFGKVLERTQHDT